MNKLLEMKNEARRHFMRTLNYIEKVSTNQEQLFVELEMLVDWMRTKKNDFIPTVRQVEMTKTMLTTLVIAHANRIPNRVHIKVTILNNMSKQLKARLEELLKIVDEEKLAFPTEVNTKRMTFDYHSYQIALKVWSGDEY